jgi:hypothetical protein
MIVIITDAEATNSINFKLTITNLPPVKTSAAMTPPILNFNKEYYYDLPSSHDPEGLHYTTTIQSGPSFVSLVSSDTKLKIFPSNCANDFTDFTVVIKLTDEEPISSAYSIDFKVNKTIPEF